MAEYPARWDEIQKKIKEVQQTEKPISFELKNLPFIDRYDKFKESLEDYIDWRDKALNNALPILKNESTSITGSVQKDKWDAHFTKQGQDAFKMILAFVPDDENTPKLRLFAEIIASQESAFFAKLSSASLAWCQGQVQEYTYQFYREMNSLEGKWKDLQSKDKSVDSKVKQTSKEVLEIFSEVVEYLANKERRGETLLREAADKVRSIPGMPLLASAGALVHEMLAKAEMFQKELDELVAEYMNAYKQQETIVVLFTQIRNSVHKFLEKTNLDTASDEFEETCKNSLVMAGQCSTKGQQDDAKKFIEKAIRIVKDYYEEFKDQYEEFVYDNQGIFVGAVVDKTIEEILEKREVNRSWQEITRFNIQAKLKDIHNDSVRAWHVDVNGLTEEQKREFENFWRIELEKLGRGLTKAADGSAVNRMKQVLVEKWRLLETNMKNSKGGLQ